MISKIGENVLARVSIYGRALIFLFEVLKACIKPPFKPSLIINQFYFLGTKSLSVIVVVGLFMGAALAVQLDHTLGRFGAKGLTGSAVALSLIRELGPVLTALMFVGRAGSSLTAELGIMKITEQVDALRSLSVDPIKYLMVPRFIAGIIVLPLLASIFNTVGILGGYIVAVYQLDMSSGTFIQQMTSSVGPTDVFAGLVKALVFGVVILWVCCFCGWNCGHGAVGVNKATTKAVVVSCVSALVINYFLATILTKVLL